MIVREWRGWASPAKSEIYPEHFRRQVLPELNSIAGFLGASLLQREDGAEIEFVVLTLWASMAAIASFAGQALDRAVVEPQAAAALLHFDSMVRHYRVLEEVGEARPSALLQ